MNADILLQEQENFIKILHGTHHSGSIIKCSFRDKKQSARPIASCIPEKLISPENHGNTYITVNRFAGRRRVSDKIFCYNGFFIDLDAHNDNEEAVRLKKENTIALLRHAVNSGEICDYTMMTDSGRGLGLYFVMPQSIAAFADTDKQIRFFKSMYVKLTKKIAEILNGEDTLEVDKSVLDATRLCRLPGTYNYDAKRYCRLIYVNEDAKYTLSEIADICGFTYVAKKRFVKKEYDERTMVNFATKRLFNLERLQKNRLSWATMHHTLCFMYFNTALVYMSFDDAVAALEEFNSNFKDYSISANEIKGIIHSSKGGNVVYKMTNKYIINHLNLTEDEVEDFFFENKISKERSHRAVVSKRIKRDKMVVKAILEFDTYEMVNMVTKVPIRTIKRIAKKYNCGHTKGVIKDFAEINWEEAYNKELHFSKSKKCQNPYVDVNKNNNPIKQDAEDEEVFHIDGVEFDVVEEDFNDDVVDTDRYGYGLSFLDYLRTLLPENKAYNMKQMKTYIYDYADRKMRGLVLTALNQIARAYETCVSADIAYWDVMRIAKAVTNGHFAFSIRGMFVPVSDKEKFVKDDRFDYPDEFKPLKTIEEIYSNIAEDVLICRNDSEMITAIAYTKDMYTRLKHCKGYEQFYCRGKLVTRYDFLHKLVHADEYVITKIINKIARFYHKRKYLPSLVDSRSIFCEYLFV